MKSEHLGRWKIHSMEVWSKDYVDMIEPGYISVNPDGTGSLAFGAVSASIDGCYSTDIERYDFSWLGHDDGEQVCGRGWLLFNSSEKAVGHIYFHLGDDSSMYLTK